MSRAGRVESRACRKDSGLVGVLLFVKCQRYLVFGSTLVSYQACFIDSVSRLPSATDQQQRHTGPECSRDSVPLLIGFLDSGGTLLKKVLVCSQSYVIGVN